MNELTAQGLREMTAAEARILLSRSVGTAHLKIPLAWDGARRSGREGVHDQAAAALIYGLRLFNRDDDEDLRNAGGLLAHLASERLRDLELVAEMADMLRSLADTVNRLNVAPAPPVLRLELAPTRKIVERDDRGDISAISEVPA